MGLLFKIFHTGDKKKQRSYISEASKFLSDFDRDYPARSDSQKKESLKHRNIFKRKHTDTVKI